LEKVGIVYDHLYYFMAVWYGLWSFGIFFPFWYVWTKKDLATLLHTTLEWCVIKSCRLSYIRLYEWPDKASCVAWRLFSSHCL
jgi:hypothetical protein